MQAHPASANYAVAQARCKRVLGALPTVLHSNDPHRGRHEHALGGGIGGNHIPDGGGIYPIRVFAQRSSQGVNHAAAVDTGDNKKLYFMP